MKTIAFVGLGAMGRPMARNLLKAGVAGRAEDGCRRGILGCCVAAFASLCLLVPVDALHAERVNRYYMGLAMRPASN